MLRVTNHCHQYLSLYMYFSGLNVIRLLPYIRLLSFTVVIFQNEFKKEKMCFNDFMRYAIKIILSTVQYTLEVIRTDVKIKFNLN